MGEKFGRYFLKEKIAVGGMANIYLADYSTIEGFKKELVVKRILSEYSKKKKFTSMFINEAKIAVNLNHRNIIQTFDFGKENDEYFISMEYIDGFDLINLYRIYSIEKNRIDQKVILFILMEVLKGLNYIHEKKDKQKGIQLIHRDISLSNIIISRIGEVKILDFGVAKTTQDNVTSGNDLRGKESYMAPEQLKREELDGRIDIYALGIVAWRLLTGDKPFELSKIKNKEELLKINIPNVKDINSSISSELSNIIMKAIEKDKNKRYLNAMEFYKAIYEYSIKNNILLNHFDFIDYIEKNEKYLFMKRGFEVATARNKKSKKTLTSYRIEVFNEANLNKKRNIVLVYCDLKGLYELHEEYSIKEVRHLMRFFSKLVSNIAYKYNAPVVSSEKDVMIFSFGTINAHKNDIINSIKFSQELEEAFYAFIKDYKINMKLSIVINRGKVIIIELFENMKIDILYSNNLLKNTRREAEKQNHGIFLYDSIKDIAGNFFELEKEESLFRVIKEKNQIKEKEKKSLIGREKEFAFLKDRVKQSFNKKNSSFNYIIGDSGIGKGFLVKNFVNFLNKKYKNFFLLKAKAVKSVEMEIFKDLLRYFFKENKKERFEEKILYYIDSIDKNKKREYIVLIGDFLGFDYSDDSYIKSLDSSIKKIDLQSSILIKFLTILSKKKHLVIILEDIEIISNKTLNFLNKLINEFKTPIFLLATAKSEILKKKVDTKKVAIINLKPLSKTVSSKVIENVIRNEFNYKNDTIIIPEKLSNIIYQKTSGNPLFIKEMVKFFIRKNTIYLYKNEIHLKNNIFIDKDIPITLETILQEDFDNLNDNEKIVLQRAALFGNQFWLSPMKKLLGDSVTTTIIDLEEKGFLYKRNIKNKFFQTEYIFKHILLKKIITDSIILKFKKSIHEEIANIFLSYNNKHLTYRTAKHYEKAGKYNIASNYYILAGNIELESFSIDKAIYFYNKYIALFDSLKNKNLKQYLKIKIKLASLNKEIGEYKKAQDILNDLQKYILRDNSFADLNYYLFYNYANLYFLTEDYENSIIYIKKSQNSTSDKNKILKLENLYAFVLYKQHFLDKANKKLEKIIKESKDSEEIVNSYSLNALILSDLGIYQKALEYEKKALSYYIKTDNWKNIFLSLNKVGNIYCEIGDIENARPFYNRAAKLISEKPIMNHLKVILNNNLAKLSSRNNKKVDTTHILKENIALLNNISIKSLHYETHKLLAENYINLGFIDKALQEISIAEKYATNENKDLMLTYKLIGSNNKNTDIQIEQLLLKILSSENTRNKDKVHKKIISFYESINPKKAKKYKENLYRKKISILYVEDELDIREGLSSFLNRFTENLYIAENGKIGLELYNKYKPDIVLSDIKMPIMNGLDMVSKIKKSNPEQHVIFLTAFGDNINLSKAINMQVDGYILKPIKLSLLKNKINSIQKLLEYKDILNNKNNFLDEIDENYKDENFLILDSNKNITYLNRNFIKLFNIENTSNEHLIKFNKIRLSKELTNWIDSIKYMESSEGIISMLNINDDKKTFKIKVQPIKDNFLMTFLLY